MGDPRRLYRGHAIQFWERFWEKFVLKLLQWVQGMEELEVSFEN